MASNLPSGPAQYTSPKEISNTSTASQLLSSKSPDSPPTFDVLLVLPFSISPNIFSLPDGHGKQKPGGQGRSEAVGEIQETYRRVIQTLQEAGLRVTVRRNPDGKEIWIMVGATERKLAELLAVEKREDFLHSVSSQTAIQSFSATIPSSEKIRLLNELITTNTLQGGLGVTPGEGAWRRVRAVVALHDEKANHAWIQSWLTKRWNAGLTSSFDEVDQQTILQIYGPSAAMYFSFVSFYARALIPLSAFGAIFWLGSKGVFGKIATYIGLSTWAFTGGLPEAGYGWSWSWFYSAIIGIWGIAVVEGWRIKERKLSVNFGTHQINKVQRLRGQYLATLPGTFGHAAPATSAIAALNASHSVRGDPTFLAREAKIAASVPVIAGMGFTLVALLTSVFFFEAFLSKLYNGPGKQVIGLIPTAIFVGVVPNVLALFHSISYKLTSWENHPTKSSHTASLTVKTFAMNAVVAYLGLFLSAFIYIPFGELIMASFSTSLSRNHSNIQTMNAEQTGLGPKTNVAGRAVNKSDRLVGQVFAYTVTNQAINAFTEFGLPYIKEYINNYRGLKKEKDAGKKSGYETTSELQRDPRERAFLKKVEREVGLIEYSNFTDYAEMVTQFGYITVWSIVWPLAPLFALINNFVELRSDAAKISSQVRRPISERVDTIGPWLQTMSVLTWMSFVTTSTLCYLFRPSLDLPATHQSINPNANYTSSFNTYGSGFLHNAIEDSLWSKTNGTASAGSVYLPHWMSESKLVRTALPMAIPALFVALLASHAYFLVSLAARQIAEKFIWEASPESKALETSEEAIKRNFLQGRFDDGLSALGGSSESQLGFGHQGDALSSAFWRETNEGQEAIAAALKTE